MQSMPPKLQSQRSTRGIKIDYTKVGDKMTMSSATCHKCKVCIALNQQNICQSLPDPLFKTAKSEIKSATKKETKMPYCQVRFCDLCLQTIYPESWKERQKNLETWRCPVCTKACKCNPCVRSRQRKIDLEIETLIGVASPPPKTTSKKTQSKTVPNSNEESMEKTKYIAKQRELKAERKKKPLVVEPSPLDVTNMQSLGLQQVPVIPKQLWSEFNSALDNFNNMLAKDWSERHPLIQKYAERVSSQQR